MFCRKLLIHYTILSKQARGCWVSRLLTEKRIYNPLSNTTSYTHIIYEYIQLTYILIDLISS
jgi:hypothetical protein